MIKVTTIYDNIESNTRFKTDWGFGCIIDHPLGRILFDTGANPHILDANLKTASINPKSINTIIISHKHSDHQGSALWLAQQNSNVKIYIPKSWNNKLPSQLSEWTPNVHTLKKDFLLNKNIYLIITENFWIRELTLAIETSHGALVFTGCSHTGIDRIAQQAQNTIGSPILALFGGFHLLNSSSKKISTIATKLKHLKIKAIAPCHCTGQKATTILETEFGRKFLHNGAGAHFTFKE